VLISPQGKHWPGDLAKGVAGSECFRPVALGPPISEASSADMLADVLVYEIDCP